MACRDVDNRLFVAAFHECARDFHHIHFVVTAVCPIPFVDERRVGEVFRFQVVCIQFFAHKRQACLFKSHALSVFHRHGHQSAFHSLVDIPPRL